MNEDRLGEFLGEFREFRGEMREGMKNLNSHISHVSRKADDIRDECREGLREHQTSPSAHGLDKEVAAGNTIRNWLALAVAAAGFIYTLVK